MTNEVWIIYSYAYDTGLKRVEKVCGSKEVAETYKKIMDDNEGDPEVIYFVNRFPVFNEVG